VSVREVCHVARDRCRLHEASVPASSRSCAWSPERKPDLQRREHECNRASGRSAAFPAGRSESLAPVRRGLLAAANAIAPGRRRTWPRYAFSGSAGVDPVVTALVLAASRTSASAARHRWTQRRRGAACALATTAGATRWSGLRPASAAPRGRPQHQADRSAM
jgi:hypothetical protein